MPKGDSLAHVLLSLSSLCVLVTEALVTKKHRLHLVTCDASVCSQMTESDSHGCARCARCHIEAHSQEKLPTA